jgi:Beta-lactamase enzyme family
VQYDRAVSAARHSAPIHKRRTGWILVVILTLAIALVLVVYYGTRSPSDSTTVIGAGRQAAHSPNGHTTSTVATPTSSTLVDADPLAGVPAYVAQRLGTVSAAVYDLKSGQTWSFGSGTPQDTASIVKLDILETLLWQQAKLGGLSAAQQALALNMIENSDNDAATTLWNEAGGTAGIKAYNNSIGLTATTPSTCVTCPGFPWPGWGLTTTSPSDQLLLLRQLVGSQTQLSTSEQQYVIQLMENVAPSERWGVSTGVTSGDEVALKNGWLPLNAADTNWQINSIGLVLGQEREYALVILTTGNPSEQYGIDTADALSNVVWQALQ